MADRPATGRSFVLIFIVAAFAALAVTIWTFYSAGKSHQDGPAPDAFRI